MSGSVTLDRCRNRGWAVVVVAIASVMLAVSASSAPVGAHAESRPTEVARAVFFDLTIRSIAEREGRTNTGMDILVPFGFDVRACRGPSDWTCAIDRTTHRPHTAVEFTAPAFGDRLDVDFVLSLTAPDQDAVFLFPTMQTNDDGFVEPWVYAEEPYPAPRVRVGEGGAVAFAPGSSHAPCIGPADQPSSYRTHDGSDGDRTPCPKDSPPTTTTSTTSTPTTTIAPATTTSAPTTSTSGLSTTTTVASTATAESGSIGTPTTDADSTSVPSSAPPTPVSGTASTTATASTGTGPTNTGPTNTGPTSTGPTSTGRTSTGPAGATTEIVDEGVAGTNLVAVFAGWAVIGALGAGCAVAVGRRRST